MESDSNACSIRAFDWPVYHIPHVTQLVPASESLVTHLFARAHGRKCVFHMAMVEWQGKGIMIPGERGSGKSTLALKLAQAGAKYYGDDLILVDTEQEIVLAFPKAVTLKQGAFHLFDEAPTYYDPLRGPVRYILPATAGHYALPLSEVSWILFPDYQPNAEPWSVPLADGWVALALVQQLFGGVDGRREALELVAELARRPAYVVGCNHLEQAVGRILDRIGRGET